MNKKIIIGGLLALVLAACVGWYFLSPGYAMQQLQAAALEGDADALEDRIDFPSVRESLKADFRAHLMVEMQKEENGFAALGGMLAMGMLDGMIDGLVSPQGMEAMIKQGKFQAQGQPVAEPTEQPEWTLERKGFSKFVAKPQLKETDKVPGLVFEREGLGWRLTKIDIPPGGLGKGN